MGDCGVSRSRDFGDDRRELRTGPATRRKERRDERVGSRKRPLKIGIMLPESEREMAGDTAVWADFLAIACAIPNITCYESLVRTNPVIIEDGIGSDGCISPPDVPGVGWETETVWRGPPAGSGRPCAGHPGSPDVGLPIDRLNRAPAVRHIRFGTARWGTSVSWSG
jgi:hypothetical protein